MLWSAPHPLVSTYRVEVSGWDSAQSFFVETANLEWDEASSKNITLGRLLCPGTMVFVRLLLPTSTERSCKSQGSRRFFAVFDSLHWKETRHGPGCLPFSNAISAVFSME